MRMINSSTRVEVQVGDTVQHFRGGEAKVTRLEKPKRPESTGRVYTDECPGGVYPSVYGLEWTEREDLT